MLGEPNLASKPDRRGIGLTRRGEVAFSRRAFLRGSAAIAAALAAGACQSDAPPAVPSPSKIPPKGPLSLPPGFQQRVLSSAGERTSDGLIVPGLHDGMAAFTHRDGVVLVRNHELLPDHRFPVEGSSPFDPGDAGGVTGVVVSPDREPIREFPLLAGTRRNCAGGSTPWGTWLTCEEFRDDAHGFVFEIVPERGDDLSARPIRAMGHFRHEAVGIDPSTGIVYLTEDSPPRSFVYRFLPDDTSARPGALHEGGRLQAMRIEDDSGPPVQPGDITRVGWVDVDADSAPETALDRGAFAFHKLEGALFADGLFWFPDTDGGREQLGQVYRYSPAQGTLELFFESRDEESMKKPDNLTMAPWGDLWFVEDGLGFDRVMGITRDGKPYEFASNGLNDSELSGPCFAPDGRTFFVNIYEPGLTIAVWGPFERLRSSA